MRFRDLALWGGAVGSAMLVYGSMVEAKRLVVERKTLRLPDWPESLDGFKVALLSDFHLHSGGSFELASQAIALALAEEPDMVAIAGDFVESWKSLTTAELEHVLEPLLLMQGAVVAVPGNHDHKGHGISALSGVLDRLNIRLLQNEVWLHLGVSWVGIDSANANVADPFATMRKVKHFPAVCLWHEPDLIGWLPQGCSLQLSGHSHGGQFIFPGGWAPMHTRNGERYPRGWYPNAPTPLYVSRGIGTTGPPARFLCPPEVAVLTLRPL
ncbi:MAG: metallophosphoesterase [Fimbriimonas sp.]